MLLREPAGIVHRAGLGSQSALEAVAVVWQIQVLLANVLAVGGALVAQLRVDNVRRGRAAVGKLGRLGGAVEVLVVFRMLGLCAGILGEVAIIAIGLSGERVVSDDTSALIQLRSLVAEIDLLPVNRCVQILTKLCYLCALAVVRHDEW